LRQRAGQRAGQRAAAREDGTQPVSTRIALRGGMVADGIGATTRLADVLADGPLIASVAAGGPAAPDCEVIDLPPGSVICPGFIDAHVHAEGPLLAAGRVDGALAQGVTTLVVGQDGESWIGATTATARYLNQYFTPVNGPLDPARDLSVAAYRDALSGRLSQNVAVLASQGTIRHNVAGMTAGALAPGELAAARQEVENALADGAVGLSSGLDYLPSRLGGIGEIAAMAMPLAAAGRPYVSHLRGYGPDVRSGLDELVAVGRTAGIRVHASHLWGEPADITAAFDSADARGVSVSYDMYPYRRSSTILAMLLLPAGLQADGPGHTLAALTDPRQRAELLAGEKFTAGFLRHVYLGCLPASHAALAGQSVTAAADTASATVPASAAVPAAAQNARTPGEWVLDLLVSTGLNAGAHLDRPGLTDGQLAWLATGDRQCGGSDGIYQGQHPHPRGYGAFARLAEHYLAAGAATGYQRIARHLAANAADAYGLRTRGRLAPGMAADICVIGPGGITARASYDAPREQAAGVSLVLVNGVVTWRDGQPVTTSHPGQLVST
jgi:N-acyl-D-amino-acid deacylase